ncbi:MAG: YggS family pyridoxal phosphate-dependent enzyme [Ruminococcus sp.]|nr:YggS family pyridoxal phosphate-dependent enzyme [Ruminococcus sp.]
MDQANKVPHEFKDIYDNIEEIRYRINDACAKYRSAGDTVRIMAVTKTVAPEKVNFAVSQGITLLGENRVQEYLSKKDYYDSSAEVHIIGHLQTNKVKYIINDAAMIQSVDSIKLAGEINRLAAKNGKVMDILVEVNIGEEESKSGVSGGSLFELTEQIAGLDNVRIRGLMAIPPIGADEACFAHMNELYEQLKEKKYSDALVDTLSMGMSGDYELAIKHGSGLVRIGTKLFGARKYLEV